MPSQAEKVDTKRELGQYLDSIPKGAKEIGTYQGAKIYEYKGVHISGKTKGQPRIEAFHPYSTMSKNIVKNHANFKPIGGVDNRIKPGIHTSTAAAATKAAATKPAQGQRPNLPGSQAAIDSAIAGTPPAFDAPSQYDRYAANVADPNNKPLPDFLRDVPPAATPAQASVPSRDDVMKMERVGSTATGSMSEGAVYKDAEGKLYHINHMGVRPMHPDAQFASLEETERIRNEISGFDRTAAPTPSRPAATPAQSLTDMAAQGAQGTTGAAGAAGPSGATASPYKSLGQNLGGGIPPVLLPQMVTAPGSPGINDAWRQNSLLQHLMQSLQQRQRTALYGQIPGAPGSTQGQELGRLSPEEMVNQAGGGGGGWGIIKEPGVLGQLLAMADASARERQAATEKQYELAKMPLDALRKYVDSEIPEQAAKLMANYAGLTGEMKSLLEDNLTKLSQEGGRIGNVARAALKNDLSSLSKELNVPKKDIEGYVASASKDYRQAIADAGGMAATAGTKAAGDIRAAAAEAAGGVLPGQEARAKKLGEGYQAASLKEVLSQSESQEEALDIVRDQYGGRKQDIIADFDEQITQLESVGLQDLMGRGLDRTTANSVTEGKVKRLRAQKQSALNQVADMAAQAKLQATNMWNQGKASARQMFATGQLGAEQATGAQIGQMAAGFAGAGQQGLTQAGLAGLSGEQARGGQLAQGLAGIGQAGLGALTDLTRQKMSGITQGYGGLMNLIQSMAGQEFGAQAGGREQMANLLSNIGLQGRSAEQRGTEFQGLREQDLGFKRSDFETAVEHKGTLDPAQLIDLAKGLGMYSQLGPPMAGNIGVGGDPGLPGQPFPPFPGGGDKKQEPGPGKPEPKPADLRNLINTISINLGGLGSPGSITGGLQSGLQGGWNWLTSPGGGGLGVIGAPGGAVAGTAGVMDYLWNLIKDNPEQAWAFVQNPDAWFEQYTGMTREEFEALPPENQQELLGGMAANQEKVKPTVKPPAKKEEERGGLLDPVLNFFGETAEEKAERAKAEAAALRNDPRAHMGPGDVDPPPVKPEVGQGAGLINQGIFAQQQPNFGGQQQGGIVAEPALPAAAPITSVSQAQAALAQGDQTALNNIASIAGQAALNHPQLDEGQAGGLPNPVSQASDPWAGFTWQNNLPSTAGAVPAATVGALTQPTPAAVNNFPQVAAAPNTVAALRNNRLTPRHTNLRV